MTYISSSQNQVTAHRVLARIVRHQRVSSAYWRMELQDDFVARNARAGQFIHLLPRSANLFDPLLRRAFSILRTDGDRFEILYRVGGKGTQSMAYLKVGEEIDVIAPLGNGFDTVEREAILVGGGVGVPPLAMLARQRFLADVQKETHVIIGARTQEDVLCIDDFRQCGVEPQVATEDGSIGRQGYVTMLLEEMLRCEGTSRIVQACGPWPMLRAVAQLCAQYEVACQVSMEENMPCGVGVCNGCVVKMTNSEDEYSMYRRVCIDGPVLWAHEVAWEVASNE